MTHSPPPDRPPRQHEPLGFDDFVGILVAFLSLGTVLAWGLAQNNQGLNFSLLDPAAPPAAPLPTVSPSPVVTRPTPSVSGAIAAPATPSPSPSLSPTPAASAPSSAVPVIPVIVPASPAAVPTTAPQNTGFSDVPPGFWAGTFIAELVRRNILVGFPDGTFRPGQGVTRAEFAVMLQKGFDQPAITPPISFTDLPADFWALPAINEAVQMGFMTGYPDGLFRPDQDIPKFQALMALVTGLRLPTPADPSSTLSLYEDANQIPNYAVNQMAAATTAQMVVNHPNRAMLNPQQVVTRADAAALIYQALVQAGKADRVNSDYIVQP